MRQTTKLLLALFILAAGVVACSTVPISGRSRLDLVSNDAVLASSFAAYNEYISKAPKSRNAAQTRRVREVGQRVASATEAYLRAVGLGADADKYRWEFNLIASDKVNAFCMPGGKIVVYEGILPLTDNDHQLATIVAHEVAHAVAKHSNERMSQQLVKQFGANVLSYSMAGKSVALQQTVGALYGLGSNVLYTLPYSRKHEFEADIIGLYLMALAGYDYTQAEKFWQNMSKGDGNKSDFLSTHPSDARRIEAIRNEIPKVRAFMEGAPEQRAAKAPQLPASEKSNLKPDVSKGRKVPLKTHY